QVGRLLRVRTRNLEVVDELAVERGVQTDQDDDDAEPCSNHTPRVARAPSGKARQGARVRNPPFLLQIRLIDHVISSRRIRWRVDSARLRKSSVLTSI